MGFGPSNISQSELVEVVQTERSMNPLEVLVVEQLRCGLARCTCAEIDFDGRLLLKGDDGQYIESKVLREFPKMLAIEEVYVGARVCIRGTLGLLACEVISILDPGRGRHQDFYEVALLNRSSDGQLIVGTTIMCRRQVYEFPASILVRPLNMAEPVPAVGEMAEFVHAENFRSVKELSRNDPSTSRLLRALAETERTLKNWQITQCMKNDILRWLKDLSTPGFFLKRSEKKDC